MLVFNPKQQYQSGKDDLNTMLMLTEMKLIHERCPFEDMNNMYMYIASFVEHLGSS
jgi:hypothetical protein